MQNVLENFHLLRPAWLLSLLPVAYLLWLYANRKRHGGQWKSVCDPKLIPHILIGEDHKVSSLGFIILTACSLLVIIALAGPSWQQLPQPVFREQSSLVILLDLSHSMDAGDIKPKRLTRAKHKILDILKRRKEGQTALVVFALEPFTVSPLTDDSHTIESMVKTLSTDLMPNQGSIASLALNHAVELLQQAGSRKGDVLLVTDGVDDAETEVAIERANQQGYHVSILGVGTDVGAPIPNTSGGFLSDNNGTGEIVIAKMDSMELQHLASIGGGVFSKMSADDADINRILRKISSNSQGNLDTGEKDKLSMVADQWKEEGPWLLLLVVPFIVLTFRRGYLLCLVLIVLPYPKDSMAIEWQDLWLTPDQQAARALSNEKVDTAADLFENPEWKGVAQYRKQDYQSSIDTLDGINTPDALYNKANALAKSGQLEQAIKSYDEALKLNPKHADAIYNRDLVKKYLKKQQEKSKDQNDKQQQQDQDKQAENQSSDQQSQDNQGEQKEGDKQNGQDASNSPSQNNNQADLNQKNKEQESKQSQQQQEMAEKDAKQEQEKQKQAMSEQARDEESSKDKNQENMQQRPNDELSEKDLEMQLANEQWLKQIPDDPGGLLRRKFQYQSQLNQGKQTGNNKPW